MCSDLEACIDKVDIMLYFTEQKLHSMMCHCVKNVDLCETVIEAQYRALNPFIVLSVFLVKIFSIFGSLSVILAHSLYCACAAPPLCTASPAPMQMIDFVRAKVAAGGELGAKVACRMPLKINQVAGK